MVNNPVVSIICYAFNHEKFIKDALDGFVMQKTNFPFEIIIHDDASTDSTAEIIREYEKEYPNILKPIYQTINQYSIEKGRVSRICYEAANGKYIALCEGDDYWIDPLKLQKQVDFLEKNPDYTLTVGGFISLQEYTGVKESIVRIKKEHHYSDIGYSFTLYDTYKNWNTKVLTAVFVNDLTLLLSLSDYQFARDVHLFYHLLKKGKGFYFTELFGTYRVHAGGVHSMVDYRKLVVGAYQIYNELYVKNKDDFSRKMNLSYHCMVLNLKIFDSSFLIEPDIKTSLLLKNIFNLIKSFSDFLLLYQIFIGVNSKRKIKALFK